MLPPNRPDALPRLSPTDISQFIRLEQCERYLRLRLHERAYGQGFLYEVGAAPQSIPPLLTHSGLTFEESMERAIATHYPATDLAGESREAGSAAVIEIARGLAPGQTHVLFQPRMQAELDGWRLTGDVDMVKWERDTQGGLKALIVDMKSSSAAKVEHRLQVAFYHAMLQSLLTEAGMTAEIQTGILYAGGSEVEDDAHREAANRILGVPDAFLEIVRDGESYLESVQDLVTGPDALARRVGELPFEAVPYHLAMRCDGCLYNEFCMKWSAQHDDLTLLPHLSMAEKSALQRAGLRTVGDLAALKVLRPRTEEAPSDLVAAPGKEALCRTLSSTWPVGPRLDELVLRARRYRKWKGDPVESLSYIPSKGYSSLPHVAPDQHPNMVWVYLDAQQDYLEDRVYLLGAKVVACQNGEPARERHIVHLAEAPPRAEADEQALFLGWIQELLSAIVTLAEPDEMGHPRAPVHLVFFNRYAMRALLDGLSRHFSTILGTAPALYDFMTQLGSFDSPIATFLEEEIRELKNYPMVCQSLQSVARYLRFDWNQGEDFTTLFRERMFDYVGRAENEEGGVEWYTRRSRFNSQIPLEYAYAGWNDLELPTDGSKDAFAPYRAVTPEHLAAFQARRLDALEWIASDFRGNALSTKTSFDLPDLSCFSEVARTLAQALEEFVTIERHVELEDWKGTRHSPPERRVLMGETLIVRYLEADQDPEVAERIRENQRRDRLKAAHKAAHPGARLTRDEKDEMDWSQVGLPVRLRVDLAAVDCDLDLALSLSNLREGSRLVVSPRWTFDERQPEGSRKRFTPTPKQMLYASRASFERLTVERDAHGRATRAFVDVVMQPSRGGAWSRGFVFGSFDRPFSEGTLYTLDEDPNNWYGYWCAKVCEGLRGLEDGTDPARHTIYERLAYPGRVTLDWPEAAASGQARFLEGLDALHAAGALHDFERGKRDYIAHYGDAPVLLVQGPPGTGKSYSTAFALLARMQGAIAAERDFRALVSCKTHAATDVLLADIVEVQHELTTLLSAHPDIRERYFEPAILTAPLFRLDPREGAMLGVTVLEKDDSPASKLQRLQAERWCMVASPPGGVYRLVKGRWNAQLLGHGFCDCLVLDEASQMNLPEAAMAGLLLRDGGQFVVVGDHRQMPPIVKHDWEREPRRTFKEYQAYGSLFETLLPLSPPMVKFEESFRLHADMAEFLRQEIYHKDGILYHSRRHDCLPEMAIADPYVAAILSPEHPLVVVLHDESESQTRNPFEASLMGPILEVLTDPAQFGLEAERGLGVVVPHRAQRAALQLAFPFLAVMDVDGQEVLRWAVDTVERFQGGERSVIVISATESDYEYLLAAGEFLMDPRRLTVALSRAKRKLILVASKSVFSLFSPNEKTFADAQLWKHLLRRTCTQCLWSGDRDGHRVEVWGNAT